jgi:hypothetical protein
VPILCQSIIQGVARVWIGAQNNAIDTTREDRLLNARQCALSMLVIAAAVTLGRPVVAVEAPVVITLDDKAVAAIADDFLRNLPDR